MKILERKTNLIKWVAITALLIQNAMPLSAQKDTTGIDNINWAIKKLTKLKVYNLDDTDGWGLTPTSWIYQQIITERASDEKLLSLTATTESPVVRLTAMNALIRRRHKRCQDIILKNLNDISSCEIKTCDFSFEEYVEDRFVEWMQNSREDGLITKADSIRNDSIILFTKGSSRLRYVHDLVAKLPCDEKYYHRLKEMYNNERVGYVLMPLLKFKKKADKEIVMKSLKRFRERRNKVGGYSQRETIGDTNAALEAVAVWPIRDFIPTLTALRNYEFTKKYFGPPRIRLLYLACLAYDNDWAYHFIDDTLGKSTKRWGKNNDHWQCFYETMRESPHPRFAPLINKYHWKGRFWNDETHENEDIK